MGQIYLVRHGQACFGTHDYDRLSELGLRQARLLGDALARRPWRVDRVVTGNMKRHAQTAEACLAAYRETLHAPAAWSADAGFDEYDADEVMVRHRPELADARVLQQELARSEHPRRAFQHIFTDAMTRWMEGAHDAEYRESWNGFRARVVAALQRVLDGAGASRNIIVFTSGGPIAAICQHLLELPHRRAFEVNASIVNSGVTGLLYQPGRVSLSFLNSHAHLDAESITYR
jgi:broad specificity phosphatase PhoE